MLGPLSDDQITMGLAAATERGGQWPMSAGDLHSLCVTEYANAIAAQRQRLDYEREGSAQPRWRCLRCQDSGMVYAWNPAFLEAYRGRWQGMALTGGRPANWVGLAHRWWLRAPGYHGSMRTVVRCDCHGERSQMFAEEQAKFANGDRKRPPACGMAIFADGITPLATVNPDADLEAYYAA